MSNLPIRNISKNTDKDVQLFFDTYFTKPINFSDNELNAVKSFFESRGFEESASIAVAVPILNQAKVDNVKVFELLDTLRNTTDLQLSAIVAEILNYNRKRTSVVGFRKQKTISRFESRNIIDGSPASVIINIGTESNFSATGFTFDSDTITWDGD